MHRLTCAAVAVAAAVAALSTGCTSHSAAPPPAGSAAPAGTAPDAMPATPDADGVGSAAGHTGGAVPESATGAGPGRRPATAPGCESRGVPVDGLLRAIRTGHHQRFDRVVFEFCGTRAPAHRLAYVDQVRRDPSDQPLPLHGQAFLHIVLPGGTTSTAPIATDPATAPRYHGPARLTPHHPLLADIAIAGDVERVLSIGVGLRRPTGLHVTVLTAPPRLVVDFWALPPDTLLWPATTPAEARRLQTAAMEGHQPWWLPGTPQSMATDYAERVLGWPDPHLRRITPTVYQVRRPGTDDHVVLTLTQPVRPADPHGLWNVADAAR
jgi:hypothetical protein